MMQNGKGRWSFEAPPTTREENVDKRSIGLADHAFRKNALTSIPAEPNEPGK
jgi:hypothetical protein